jgi:hypothetical protein
MNGPHTRPAAGFDPYAYSVSQSEPINNGDGNVNRIFIDFGKQANSTFISAAICGICLAVTVGTVWHSKEREIETQARIRVLQNHIDENTALLRVMEKDHATR